MCCLFVGSLLLLILVSFYILKGEQQVLNQYVLLSHHLLLWQHLIPAQRQGFLNAWWFKIDCHTAVWYGKNWIWVFCATSGPLALKTVMEELPRLGDTKIFEVKGWLSLQADWCCDFKVAPPPFQSCVLRGERISRLVALSENWLNL